MPARYYGFFVLAFFLSACPVDERHLELAHEPDSSGSSGSSSVGGSHAGSGSAGEGGAGAGSSPDGLVDGCADLDTDGVADCESTLVKNPSFTSDVEDWTRLGEARLAWDRKNALADLPSGSAKLTDDSSAATAPLASAFQCTALHGEELVIAYANAFVEPTSDADDSPKAGLEISFFQGDDCSGQSDGFFETPPSSVVGEWTTIQAGGLSKETTRSVLVELVGIKTESASELTVYFDNVMLKAQAP